MSQKERILDYLRTHDWMTGRDAVNELGIMCYTKRISELRRDGYPIESTVVECKNRYGQRASYTRYSLKEV